jgi:hypothetical protein
MTIPVAAHPAVLTASMVARPRAMHQFRHFFRASTLSKAIFRHRLP